MKRFAAHLIVAAALWAVASPVPVGAETPIATIGVTSPTVQAAQPVPRQHTPDGPNTSPALNWSNVPPKTKELMVFCEDPDVGNPPPFVHWVVYNIPATLHGIPASLPLDPAVAMPPGLEEVKQGTSGFRRPIYRGPAPPPGKAHFYHFVVYALDAPIRQKSDTPPMTRAELLEAAKGHVIGRGELVATYQRK